MLPVLHTLPLPLFPPLLHSLAPPSFFFNDTATPATYTLSLHDALPISRRPRRPRLARGGALGAAAAAVGLRGLAGGRDRKSTRLNSSHLVISYAVFCLKKKKNSATTSARATVAAA